MALWVVARPVRITLSIQCEKIRDEKKHEINGSKEEVREFFTPYLSRSNIFPADLSVCISTWLLGI